MLILEGKLSGIEAGKVVEITIGSLELKKNSQASIQNVFHEITHFMSS